LQRLGQVWRGDGLHAGQIGDGVRQFEDTMEARAESCSCCIAARRSGWADGSTSQNSRTSAGPISALQVTRGAEAKRRAWIAHAARTRSRTVAHGRRALGLAAIRQLLVVHPWRLDVDVNTIQERAAAA
jgi:hypothetical protein